MTAILVYFLRMVQGLLSKPYRLKISNLSVSFRNYQFGVETPLQLCWLMKYDMTYLLWLLSSFSFYRAFNDLYKAMKNANNCPLCICKIYYGKTWIWDSPSTALILRVLIPVMGTITLNEQGCITLLIQLHVVIN